MLSKIIDFTKGVFRFKKALDAANGRPCVNCGAQNETVVRAHYGGLRQHLYGKGKGIKSHDCIGADLCYTCHSAFDQNKIKNATYAEKIDKSEQFLHLCWMTFLRDLREGVYDNVKLSDRFGN